MRYLSKIACLVGLVVASACTKPNVFADYRQEVFPQTAINNSSEKVVRLVNPHADTPQHIGAIGFNGGGNADGNFEIAHVVVAGKVVPKSDIVVPGGAALEIHLIYHPQNMKTTLAHYGGWDTGEPIREVPLAPGESVPKAGATPVHRGMLAVTYHSPEEGVISVELVGTAHEGKNGEAEAGGGAGAPCTAEGTTACFRGTFAIAIEGLVKGDPIAYPMGGPVALDIESGTARMSMDKFPYVLIVLKGNGPGEPLEGQPLSALSIIVSGAKGITAVGSFDGSSIDLQGVGMRIRIRPGEVAPEDVNPSMDAMADFELNDIHLTTSEPLTTGDITFNLDTTLSEKPSGNEIVDGFLAGAHVVVEMKGLLDLP